LINTYQINISGQVQGVGFRPFIFNLAKKMRLKGFVSNDGNGVSILIQGEKPNIEAFLSMIEQSKPQNSRIAKILFEEIPTQQLFDTFFVKPPEENIIPNIPLTPDFATCARCEKEIFDSRNRRYFYPFTTCTHCGPRYAVTLKYPFERENTSVARFEMCPKCRREYVSPNHIRFHSQTNSCPQCGVNMKFTDNKGVVLERDNKRIFELAAEKLSEGKIIAVKNTSGYLLLCDASNKKAIGSLRKRKMRPCKPFAVLFPSMDKISEYLHVNDCNMRSFLSPESPINIIPIKDRKNLAVSEICPGMDCIGAMFPYTGMLKLIAKTFEKPFIATSGNVHHSPVCSSETEAVLALQTIADYFIHHDLEILHPQDDSVILFSAKHQQKIILRRSRGLAPNFFFSDELEVKNRDKEKILCLGSDLKSSFCAVPNHHCYLSEYIGDLSNYDTFLRYEKTIRSYRHIFSFRPQIILSDKHPLFENVQVKHSFPNVKEHKIQHHEAHFAAILGEHRLWESDKAVLGVVWDGAGFSTKDEIWGGEFFVYHKGVRSFSHVAQLDKFAWILGDKMAENPKISALSISANDPYLKPFFQENEWLFYTRQIEKRQVVTSSVGRLFDAVSFVLGFNRTISFEGEAAMYVEKMARSAFFVSETTFTDYLPEEKYTCDFSAKNLLLNIIHDLSRHKPETVALNFHYTLIKMIEKIAVLNGMEAIAFSGGVFQNSLLVDLAIDILKPEFELYFHENISPNDENIAFGQLNYYLNMIKQR
jgi:hydrogenase maturation protein HypF